MDEPFQVVRRFKYTFDHIASVIDDFAQAIGLSHSTLYMQDYGGPVGFRMALAHPERVEALIVQNAVAHNEGLGAIWATRRAFWADRSAYETALRDNLLSFATTRSRHIGADPKTELYDPDLWTDEYRSPNAPGQAQIQTDLFYDYRTNVAAYPKWQACYSRRSQSFWSSGASTILRSISASRNVSARTSRTRGFMYSTRDTSRLIPKQMRLQRCYASS
jgi:pimeloyl-ACP methyl ester carboxylesterase